MVDSTKQGEAPSREGVGTPLETCQLLSLFPLVYSRKRNSRLELPRPSKNSRTRSTNCHKEKFCDKGISPIFFSLFDSLRNRRICIRRLDKPTFPDMSLTDWRKIFKKIFTRYLILSRQDKKWTADIVG